MASKKAELVSLCRDILDYAVTAEGELNGRKHGFASSPKEKEVFKRFISAY